MIMLRLIARYISYEDKNRFAAIVARYERLRAQLPEAERQVDGLFESLLAEVFNA
jgi:hypothetical protein